MNPFEKIVMALLGAASAEAPLFVHSAQGTLILNASEVLLGSIMAVFAPAQGVAQSPPLQSIVPAV